MKNTKRKKNLAFLLLTAISTFCLLSCSEQELSIEFPKEQQVVEIPFHYCISGNMITKAVILEDTLSLIIDTGASMSIVPTNNSLLGANTTTTAADSKGITRKLPTTKVKHIEWGGVIIKNLTCAMLDSLNFNADGIIGGDLLRNFCVKIDNVRKKIMLAKSSGAFEPEGECIPFDLQYNCIYFAETLAGKKDTFLFDSGYSGEINIGTPSAHLEDKVKDDNQIWIDGSIGLFSTKSNPLKDSVVCVLANFSLGDKKIAHTIVAYNNGVNYNLIGTVFIRRFASITIDYPASIIWFTFPDDIDFVKFSGKRVKDVPAAYLNLFYKRINSLGMQLNKSVPFTIHALQYRQAYENIQAGDTLVGIDNMLFNEATMDKIIETDSRTKFYVEEDTIRQKAEVLNTFSRGNKAILHFLKHGKIESVSAVRDTQMSPLPALAYGFSSDDFKYGFSAIRFDLKNLWMGIPWSTLMGKEQTVTFYKNGKEQTVSNIPPEDE
ncbi:hypothetical protein SAMN06265379_105168 [Saccharicrinis carchari]|uniref:Aspartyl protease n=1 Tax=Saccharicrinis carchari TaxID=1168039 RepID=A0A521DIP1_SACCC|nr:hypothetical protein [Saccharicrinis carchari]SMO70780.1 hypothetical protein SAMN06265379_105168 [Saccharicrinis carchari]